MAPKKGDSAGKAKLRSIPKRVTRSESQSRRSGVKLSDTEVTEDNVALQKEEESELLKSVTEQSKSFKDKEGLEVDADKDMDQPFTPVKELDMEQDMSIKFDWERREEYFQPVREYWQRVSESDGFDIEGIPIPPCTTGLLMPYDCKTDITYAYPTMVKLYAHLGLHRYNMLKGKNFKLESLVKFNMKMSCASSYYITLDASDRPQVFISNKERSPPAVVRLCFQVRIDEICHGTLDVSVSIARPKGTTTGYKAVDKLHERALPEWPSDFRESRRFYELKETELHSIDWIDLYFGLVICSHDRRVRIKALANYELVSVVIEAFEEVADVEMPKEKIINARKAYFYITYRHLDVICKATVRRIIDGSENLILRGVLVRC